MFFAMTLCPPCITIKQAEKCSSLQADQGSINPNIKSMSWVKQRSRCKIQMVILRRVEPWQQGASHGKPGHMKTPLVHPDLPMSMLLPVLAIAGKRCICRTLTTRRLPLAAFRGK